MDNPKDYQKDLLRYVALRSKQAQGKINSQEIEEILNIRQRLNKSDDVLLCEGQKLLLDNLDH